MKIAMTGVSGNMGAEALRQTLGLPGVERVRVLLTRRKKNEFMQAMENYLKGRLHLLNGR